MTPDTYTMSDIESAAADVARALEKERPGDAYVIRVLLTEVRKSSVAPRLTIRAEGNLDALKDAIEKGFAKKEIHPPHFSLGHLSADEVARRIGLCEGGKRFFAGVITDKAVVVQACESNERAIILINGNSWSFDEPSTLTQASRSIMFKVLR